MRRHAYSFFAFCFEKIEESDLHPLILSETGLSEIFSKKQFATSFEQSYISPVIFQLIFCNLVSLYLKVTFQNLFRRFLVLLFDLSQLDKFHLQSLFTCLFVKFE